MNKGCIRGAGGSASAFGSETNVASVDPSTHVLPGVRDRFYIDGVSSSSPTVQRIAKETIIWVSKPSFTSSFMSHMAFGDGNYVAVNSLGAVYQSVGPRAFGWTLRASGVTMNRLAFGNGLFVGVGNSGVIRTSTDTVTWTTQTSNTTSGLFAAAYDNGTWVVGGQSGVLRTSTDAVTWVTRSSNVGTSSIFSVAYGGGAWVLGGASGIIRRSTDNGVTWTTVTSNVVGSSINFIAYGNNTFAASSQSFSVLRTSTDGIAWVTVQVPGGLITSSMLFGNENFLFQGGGVVMTSRNATTWTTQDYGALATTSFSAIAYGEGLWVMGATSLIRVGAQANHPARSAGATIRGNR